MLTILNVVTPVFALVALGYCAVRFRLYPAAGVGGMMSFVNNFATPILLFRSMLTVDFGTAFNLGIISGFYAGALVVLFLGALLSARLFGNRPGEAVSSGFSAMFTNTVLLGIPIVSRAYGDGALPVVYSIIGFHAPVLITVGMVFMEVMRRDGGKVTTALMQAGKGVIRNPLLWGIVLGSLGNLFNVTLVEPADAFTRMMAQAVLPVALFAIGAALNQYKLTDNWRQAGVMSFLKLVVHPAIAWVIMVPILRVDPQIARYGVLLAAMPSGVNTYIFATLYNRGVNVATNTILIATVSSVVTVTIWLALLGA